MNEVLFEKIEEFLDGALSREELERLASELGETELDETIEWMRDSRLAIEAEGLREQLNTLLPPIQEKTEAKVRRLPVRRWVIGLAASVLLIIVAYWGFNRNGVPALYAEFEYVDPGLPVLMGQSDQFELYDALTYYGEGDYATTESKLRQLEERLPANDTLQYFLGASLLYQGKTKEAQTILQQVSGNSSSGFRQKAEWLLVLTALRDDNLEAAKSALGSIIGTPTHPFYVEAQRLQTELR